MLNRLWVILVVYTSTSKDEVNTLLFRELCEETYDLLLNSFQNSESKWINVSPTLHMLLAHSWEVIENNNNCGVGEYSETSLEHNNKFLRFFQTMFSTENIRSHQFTRLFGSTLVEVRSMYSVCWPIKKNVQNVKKIMIIIQFHVH